MISQWDTINKQKSYIWPTRLLSKSEFQELFPYHEPPFVFPLPYPLSMPSLVHAFGLTTDMRPECVSKWRIERGLFVAND